MSSERPKAVEPSQSDQAKAFEYLEKDVFQVQLCIDKMQRVAKSTKDMGVYRGRLASKRTLHPVSRLLSSLTGEISANVPQMRTFHVTESLYHLISNSVGTAYSKAPIETILRLSMLKSQLLDLTLKKLSELALLHLWIRVDEDTIGQLSGPISILLYTFEVMEGGLTTQSGGDQGQARDNELQGILKEKEEAIEGLRRSLEEAGKKVTNLEAKVTTSEGKTKTIIEEYERKITEIVSKHKSDIRREPSKKASFVQTDPIPADTQKAVFEQQIAALTHENAFFQQEISQYQSSTRRLEAEITVLNSSAQQRLSDISVLQASLAAVSQSSAQQSTLVAELTAERNSLQESVKSLERSLSDSEFQCERLMSDLKSIESKRGREANSHYEMLLTAAKETETYLEAQVAVWVKKCGELMTEVEAKEADVQGLVRIKKQFEEELETAKETIMRLHRSLSELINMDEDTFEAVMKHEMEMMQSAYESRLKEQRSAYDRLKREKLLETKSLREALLEKERVLDLTTSKLAFLTGGNKGSK